MVCVALTGHAIAGVRGYAVDVLNAGFYNDYQSVGNWQNCGTGGSCTIPGWTWTWRCGGSTSTTTEGGVRFSLFVGTVFAAHRCVVHAWLTSPWFVCTRANVHNRIGMLAALPVRSLVNAPPTATIWLAWWPTVAFIRYGVVLP